MGIDLNRFKGKRDQEWLDWLEDDPVPASVRARMREKAVRGAYQPTVRRVGQQNDQSSTVSTTSVSKSHKTKDDSVKQISVNIQLPNIDKVKAKGKQAYSIAKKTVVKQKKALVGVAAVAVMSAGIVGVMQLKNNATDNGGDSKGVLSEKTEKPTFEYSLPKGDAANANGEVRFDADKKVVNFQDSIGGVTITISQQPLPEGFDKDTDDKVKKLAADFSATQSLTTASPTAYLGTSEKGPQTVVFTKKKLLVFIQSAKKIDDKDWAEYVTNLQ